MRVDIGKKIQYEGRFRPELFKVFGGLDLGYRLA